jgi:hypothetical protein
MATVTAMLLLAPTGLAAQPAPFIFIMEVQRVLTWLVLQHC